MSDFGRPGSRYFAGALAPRDRVSSAAREGDYGRPSSQPTGSCLTPQSLPFSFDVEIFRYHFAFSLTRVCVWPRTRGKNFSLTRRTPLPLDAP